MDILRRNEYEEIPNPFLKSENSLTSGLDFPPGLEPLTIF